jgi:hypothetical protein
LNITAFSKTSRDLIFQEIRIYLWHISNLIFGLFRHVILLRLWCNEKKVLKKRLKFINKCFWRNLSTFSNYRIWCTVGETNGQHTSFYKKCCPLISLFPIGLTRRVLPIGLTCPIFLIWCMYFLETYTQFFDSLL